MLAALLLCGLLTGVYGHHMLFLFPWGGADYARYVDEAAAALVKRGHNVTVLMTTQYHESHHPALKYLPLTLNDVTSGSNMSEPALSVQGPSNLNEALYLVLCEMILTSPEVSQVMQTQKWQKTYDVLVTDALARKAPSLLILGHELNIPTVNLNIYAVDAVVNYVHGNDLQVGSYPNPNKPLPNLQQGMTWKEQLDNMKTIVQEVSKFIKITIPFHERLVRKHFPYDLNTHLADIVRNVTMTLGTFEPDIDGLQTSTVNLVSVPGLFADREMTILPENLRDFLSKRTPFIIFDLTTDLGFNVEKGSLVYDVSLHTKSPVVWLLADQDIHDDIPENVITVQRNMRHSFLFAESANSILITQATYLQYLEPLYYKKPVLIYMLGNEHQGIKHAVELYAGLGLGDAFSNNKFGLTQSITKIMNQPMYFKRAKEWGGFFRTKLKVNSLTGAEGLSFWLDYAIHHPDHLKNANAYRSWYSRVFYYLCSHIPRAPTPSTDDDWSPVYIKYLRTEKERNARLDFTYLLLMLGSIACVIIYNQYRNFHGFI